jgi:hypothetical protein
MSEFKIKDGSGTGVLFKVSSEGRGLVDATSTAEFAHASVVHERAFVAVSQIQALTTTGAENGNIYLKNTGSKRLLIHSIRSCGNVQQKWRMYKNPTTGTLISGATSTMVTNLDLSSPRTASVTAYSGGDGLTVTDGTMFEHWQNDQGYSEEIFWGGLVLDTGNAVALTAEVPSAGDVCSRILFYEEG